MYVSAPILINDWIDESTICRKVFHWSQVGFWLFTLGKSIVKAIIKNFFFSKQLKTTSGFIGIFLVQALSIKSSGQQDFNKHTDVQTVGQADIVQLGLTDNPIISTIFCLKLKISKIATPNKMYSLGKLYKFLGDGLGYLTGLFHPHLEGQRRSNQLNNELQNFLRRLSFTVRQDNQKYNLEVWHNLATPQAKNHLQVSLFQEVPSFKWRAEYFGIKYKVREKPLISLKFKLDCGFFRRRLADSFRFFYTCQNCPIDFKLCMMIPTTVRYDLERVATL